MAEGLNQSPTITKDVQIQTSALEESDKHEEVENEIVSFKTNKFFFESAPYLKFN